MSAGDEASAGTVVAGRGGVVEARRLGRMEAAVGRGGRARARRGQGGRAGGRERWRVMQLGKDG